MQLKKIGEKTLAIDSDNVEVRPARHEQSGIGIAFDVVASGIGIIFRPLSKIEEKLPVCRVGMVRSQVIFAMGPGVSQCVSYFFLGGDLVFDGFSGDLLSFIFLLRGVVFGFWELCFAARAAPLTTRLGARGVRGRGVLGHHGAPGGAAGEDLLTEDPLPEAA